RITIRAAAQQERAGEEYPLHDDFSAIGGRLFWVLTLSIGARGVCGQHFPSQNQGQEAGWLWGGGGIVSSPAETPRRGDADAVIAGWPAWRRLRGRATFVFCC